MRDMPTKEIERTTNRLRWLRTKVGKDFEVRLQQSWVIVTVTDGNGSFGVRAADDRYEWRNVPEATEE